MGNCVSIDIEKDCMLCYGPLERRYICCGNCKCRFHHKCMMKVEPGLNRCVSCNKGSLCFIDERIDEKTRMQWESGSKKVRHRHYTI